MSLAKILTLGGVVLLILGVTLIATARSVAQSKGNGSLVPAMTPKTAAIAGWVMIAVAILAEVISPVLPS